MTARCVKTDLLIGECGDSCCRPDLTPTRREHVDATSISMTFTARYDTPCDYCEGRIRKGEQMGLDRDGDKVCERCLP